MAAKILILAVFLGSCAHAERNSKHDNVNILRANHQSLNQSLELMNPSPRKRRNHNQPHHSAVVRPHAHSSLGIATSEYSFCFEVQGTLAHALKFAVAVGGKVSFGSSNSNEFYDTMEGSVTIQGGLCGGIFGFGVDIGVCGTFKFDYTFKMYLPKVMTGSTYRAVSYLVKQMFNTDLDVFNRWLNSYTNSRNLDAFVTHIKKLNVGPAQVDCSSEDNQNGIHSAFQRLQITFLQTLIRKLYQINRDSNEDIQARENLIEIEWAKVFIGKDMLTVNKSDTWTETSVVFKCNEITKFHPEYETELSHANHAQMLLAMRRMCAAVKEGIVLPETEREDAWSWEMGTGKKVRNIKKSLAMMYPYVFGSWPSVWQAKFEAGLALRYYRGEEPLNLDAFKRTITREKLAEMVDNGYTFAKNLEAKLILFSMSEDQIETALFNEYQENLADEANAIQEQANEQEAQCKVHVECGCQVYEYVKTVSLSALASSQVSLCDPGGNGLTIAGSLIRVDKLKKNPETKECDWVAEGVGRLFNEDAIEITLYMVGQEAGVVIQPSQKKIKAYIKVLANSPKFNVTTDGGIAQSQLYKIGMGIFTLIARAREEYTRPRSERIDSTVMTKMFIKGFATIVESAALREILIRTLKTDSIMKLLAEYLQSVISGTSPVVATNQAGVIIEAEWENWGKTNPVIRLSYTTETKLTIQAGADSFTGGAHTSWRLMHANVVQLAELDTGVFHYNSISPNPKVVKDEASMASAITTAMSVRYNASSPGDGKKATRQGR
eukprot:jgi/Bigna1/147253/aug1.135_g21961